MTRETLDVVALLPPRLNDIALELSDRLARDMRAGGHRSRFRLGEPFDGGPPGPCAPHVSLFMLAVDDAEIGAVVDATRDVAAGLPALAAVGEEYRHNPVGAPELYFRRTADWIGLQRAVLEAVEPLRRGRLREVDPAGERIADVLADPAADPARRRQLARFGYDEVTETWPPGADDRFNPHVTLAWPEDPRFRVDLGGLPAATAFRGTLPGLAVYGMSPYGTCTTLYGLAPFGGSNGGNAAGTLYSHSAAAAEE
ncbi:hypothetical protein FHX81_8090 [Saccharothrix saharensis]|uniref:2'-5' RNA ligase superfamily protein n=1 Tax=Saccharothrix saharensis TaxID=571190 RepID=A0A543JRV9_9PSEU|nr:hypothetical protein [Saccharothrix saharensis]TQM85596.1 hypothetical protein FHX81_8090 [Saccharothrix saharensis]